MSSKSNPQKGPGLVEYGLQMLLALVSLVVIVRGLKQWRLFRLFLKRSSNSDNSDSWIYRWILADRSLIPEPTQELRNWRIMGGIGMAIIYFIHLVAAIRIVILENRANLLIKVVLHPIFSFFMFTKIGEFRYFKMNQTLETSSRGKIFLIVGAFDGGGRHSYIMDYILLGFAFNDLKLLKIVIPPALIGGSISAVLTLWISRSRKLDDTQAINNEAENQTFSISTLDASQSRGRSGQKKLFVLFSIFFGAILIFVLRVLLKSQPSSS